MNGQSTVVLGNRETQEMEKKTEKRNAQLTTTTTIDSRLSAIYAPVI